MIEISSREDRAGTSGAASLRLSLNIKPIAGPFGGGNQVANYLERALVARGHLVSRQLEPELDAILIVNAEPGLASTSYTVAQIAEYRALNPQTIVVQRVNTSDEARGIKRDINEHVLRASNVADHVVFVSEYIKDLFIGHGFDDSRPHCVIRTGSDESIFHAHGGSEWAPGTPLRFVTHHWSPNYLKGWDIYERLDQMLGEAPYRNQFAFTCVGTVPYGVRITNAQRVEVLPPQAMGEILRDHHVYVTGARGEAAGNHYIEALQCGLPVLYLESGANPEYCASYGVGFRLRDFEAKLQELPSRYAELRKSVISRSYVGATMAGQYCELLLGLVAERRRHPLPPPSLEVRWRHLARRGRRALGRARRLACRLVCG